jgi:hypothetical protein
MKKITAYKAFNKDMKCRGFQYEVGKTYKHDGEVSLCNSGFHACTKPLDILNHYDLIDSKFAIVEVIKPKKKKGGDTKIATAEITIKAELTLPDFIKNSVDYLINATKSKASSGDYTKQASSGYRAQQASSGYGAKQASSGDYAQQASSGDDAKQASSGYGAKQASSGDGAQQASSGDYTKQASSGDYTKQASSGDYAQQASSGDYTKQASSGYGAQHTCEGEKSVIASSGRHSQVKGVKGTWISLAEYKYGECVGFATGCIGKKGLKPDTWYKAQDGKLVEVK